MKSETRRTRRFCDGLTISTPPASGSNSYRVSTKLWELQRLQPRKDESPLHLGSAHESSLTGTSGSELVNNFAWDTLERTAGNSLDLMQGSADAQYVNDLDLQGRLGQLSDLTASNGVTVYFNAKDPQNAHLAGNVYSLGGGGALDPFLGSTGSIGTLAEPGTLSISGLGILALSWASIRRRRGSHRA